jgi:hypothetical protein
MSPCAPLARSLSTMPAAAPASARRRGAVAPTPRYGPGRRTLGLPPWTRRPTRNCAPPACPTRRPRSGRCPRSTAAPAATGAGRPAGGPTRRAAAHGTGTAPGGDRADHRRRSPPRRRPPPTSRRRQARSPQRRRPRVLPIPTPHRGSGRAGRPGPDWQPRLTLASGIAWQSRTPAWRRRRAHGHPRQRATLPTRTPTGAHPR